MGFYRVLPGKVLYANRQWHQEGATVELTNEEAYIRRASIEPVEDAPIAKKKSKPVVVEGELL